MVDGSPRMHPPTPSIAPFRLSTFTPSPTNQQPTPAAQPEFLQKFIQFDPHAMARNIGMLWVLAAGLQFLTYVNVVVRLRATKVVN